MAKRILSVAFKAYQQHQAMLLPPSLDELISQGHPVRIVNQVLDKIDIDPLLKKYKGVTRLKLITTSSRWDNG